MLVITRWFSWLDGVIHHKKYFDYYPTMMETVQNDFEDTAGVRELVELSSNEKNYKAITLFIDLWWKNYKIF